MPFSTPNIIQGVSFKYAAGSGPITFAFGSNLTAGSCILIVAGMVESVSSQTLFFGTITGGSTWSSALSARDGSLNDYAPNLSCAWLANVSAGASPTYSMPFRRWDGSAYQSQTTNLKVSGYAVEIGNVPTSNPIDASQVKFATSGSGATNTTTAGTGTLSQDTHRIFGAGAGWFGDPALTATYALVGSAGDTDIANGASSLLGFHLASKALTGTTAAQSYTQSHPDGGGGQAALIIPVKGKSTTSYQYQFELPAAQFPTSLTNIVVYVWRNVAWHSAVPEAYTIATPSITVKPGDSTRNLLKLPADPAALLSDTVTGIVIQSSSGKRAGPGIGSVV